MAGGLELCADCDTVNPRWASVNRGVLLCEDCSAIHRQLGRHVSQVKHLTKSRWRNSLSDMVRQLSSAGVNKYWEHILLEPSTNGQQSGGKHLPATRSSRKPAPNDPAHPNKAEFIKEKYLFMAFFKRPAHYKQEDLNHQLHASVRTSVLETSLYLLALGANPNFVHPLKRTTPLHVAVQYNQITQVELLLTYGANLLTPDLEEITPLQIAMQNSQLSGKSWSPMVDCLIQSQYEMCDSFSYYLSRQLPDHRKSEHHFFIPRLPTDSIDTGIAAMEAKRKLQHLPNDAFVNLCIDVYDEVERRETNQIRQNLRDTHQQKNDDLLLFLPPHRAYSSTRNQGRQKLGRFGLVEFNTLVLDVLIEAKCRMQAASLSGSSSTSSVVSRGRHSMLVMAGHPCQSSKDHSPLLNHSHKPVTPNHSESSQSQRRNSLPGLSVDLDIDFTPVYDYVPNDSDYASVFDLEDNSHPVKDSLNQTASPGVFSERMKPAPPLRTTPLQSSIEMNSISASSAYQSADCKESPMNMKNNDLEVIASSEPKPQTELDNSKQTVKMELRDLLNRVEDLEARNKLLECRNKELENRSKRLEQKMFVMKSEKESLLNAITLPSKEGEESSETATPIIVQQRRRRDHSDQPPSSRREPPVIPRRSSSGSSLPLTDHSDKNQELNSATKQNDLSANRAMRREIKSGGLLEIRESEKRNNYALGSESFNTGVMLRQEILQRGPSNERRERPLSQQSQSIISKRGPTPDLNDRFLSNVDAGEKDNYVAPSSTGFSSPIPRGSSPGPRTYSPTPNEPLLAHPVPIIPAPPSHKHAAVIRSPNPQRKAPTEKQSTQAQVKFFPSQSSQSTEVSIMTKERDYDSPPEDGDMSNCLPNTERVVKGVDAVTIQIRALLEVANSKNKSDFLSCSRNIQAAVQSMIALFPPSYRRGQGQIGLPLNSLSTHARELRRHCENRATTWTPQGEELTTLIHHAHEIAKSAKQLLTFLQKTNRGQTSKV